MVKERHIDSKPCRIASCIICQAPTTLFYVIIFLLQGLHDLCLSLMRAATAELSATAREGFQLPFQSNPSSNLAQCLKSCLCHEAQVHATQVNRLSTGLF